MADNQRQQAKAKAQRMLEAGKSQERVAAKTGLAPQRVERLASQISAPAAEPKTPSYTGELAQYAAPGGFGAGAAMRARAAGLSDAQIKAGVEDLRSQGMAIGKRVDIGLNPIQYGNDMAVRGAQQGGFTDMGSGQRYGMRAIYLPDDLKHIGGGLGVVWAAGPGTDQQIIDMYRGKPRESWVLPASTNTPDMPYAAPAGVPYINPLSSPSEQAKQAVGGYEFFGGAPTAAQLQPSTTTQTTKAAETKAPVSRTKSQSVLQGKRKESAKPAARNQLLENYIQRFTGKKQLTEDTDWDWFARNRPALRRIFA